LCTHVALRSSIARIAAMKTVSVVLVVLLLCGLETPAFPFQIRSPHSAQYPRSFDMPQQDTGGSSVWTRVTLAMSEKSAANPSELVTPLISTESAPFNFGPASSRDCVLYTCHCPGYSGKEERILLAEQKKRIDSWVKFMKQKQGVTQVIALLDDNELMLPSSKVNHAAPVDLRDVYSQAQIPLLVQPMRDGNAYRTIMECIDTVASQGGKVVVHCTGGVGRAGRVASGWLVHR
jgi:hypothetical protein